VPAISNSDKKRLSEHAARLRLGKLNTQEFARLINSLADSGVYHDEFLSILYPSDYRVDFVEAAEASLHRLGLLVPKSIVDAVSLLTDITTERMLDKAGNPLQDLEQFWADLDWNDTYVANCGLDGLKKVYWQYDALCFASEAPPNEDLRQLEKRCRAAAAVWRSANIVW
jgi:hypothetical protein